MKIMTGLLSADAGTVLLQGTDMTRATRQKWNARMASIGVVFQGSALFDSLTVLENVGIRMFEQRNRSAAEIRDLVIQALESVGLDSQVLGKYPSELSGGMQKRVAIARAIIHTPALLFFDEPTSGLDPVTSDRIDDLIRSVSEQKGRTSVIITHDMVTVKRMATHVAFIHAGKLHFEGTPEALFHSSDPDIQHFLSRTP